MATLGQAGRVGAVVVLGLVLVTAMFTFFNGSAFRHTYTLDVLFDDATGAAKDVPVTLAGVQIGSVRDIRLTPGQKADLTLEIKDTHQIPRGSTFSIVTPLLGSTGSVVITPPADAAARPNDTIQPNATNLVGQPSMNVSTAFAKANNLIAQLTESARRSDKLIDALTQTAVSTNQIIQGRDTRKTLNNLTQASTNGLRLTQQLSSILIQDNAQVQTLLRETQSGAQVALGNIDQTTGQFKTLATENRAKLNEIVSDLQDTTASVAGITGQLNESFKDGQVPKNLASIVANMKTASDNLVVISDNFQKLSADQGLQGDLRETLHNIRASTEQTTYLLERLNQIAGTKPHSTVVVAPSGGPIIVTPGSTPPGGTPPIRTNQGLIAPTLLPRYDLVQDLRASHFRTDLDAVLPLRGSAPGAFARVGVYGFGDTNRGILQAGVALDRNGLFDARAGLYASKLSVGGDIGLGRKETLSLDLWDPNRLHVDARGVLMFTDDFGLLIGAEDITRRTSPTVGVEFRR